MGWLDGLSYNYLVLRTAYMITWHMSTKQFEKFYLSAVIHYICYIVDVVFGVSTWSVVFYKNNFLVQHYHESHETMCNNVNSDYTVYILFILSLKWVDLFSCISSHFLEGALVSQWSRASTDNAAHLIGFNPTWNIS